MAITGERVRIVLVRAGIHLQKRLFNMGLHVNDVITIEHSLGNGAVVVSKKGHKLGLGGGMAQKIFVNRE